MRFSKKAAMFGLDARIALAIFGALSVITGVALYSAIQQTKVTRTITIFKEVEKAVEQYYLDTGKNLPISTGGSNAPKYNLSAYALIEKPSNVKGWKGPYLSYKKYASDDGLIFPETDGFILIGYRKSGDWASTNFSDQGCYTNMKSCSTFVIISKLDSKIEQEIEKRIDGTKDGTMNLTGNVIDTPSTLHIRTNIPFNPKLSINNP